MICFTVKYILYGEGLNLSHEGAFGTLYNMRVKLADELMHQPLGEVADGGTGKYKKSFVEEIGKMCIRDRDYAAYARTRGLSEWQIIVRHGFKNSLPPVITLFGQYLGYMLAGSAVAEKVFSLNGVGTYLVSCGVSGDSSAAAACIVIIATVFVIANLAADVVNRLICPWMVREIND